MTTRAEILGAVFGSELLIQMGKARPEHRAVVELDKSNRDLLAALKELLAASYGRNAPGVEGIRRLAAAEEAAEAAIAKEINP